MIYHNYFGNNEEYKRDFPFLFRFFSLPKFIDLIITRSFHFSRLDKFTDKSEGISQRQLAKYFKHKIKFKSKRIELNLEKRQKLYYACCWYSAERESIAMWDLYSDPSSIGLRLSYNNFIKLFCPDKLIFKPTKKLINYYYINKISYKNYLNIKDVEDFKDETKVIGFQKDKSFEHEKEVRVLLKCRNGVYEKNDFNSISDYEFFKVKPLHFQEIPFRVIFNPKMKASEKSNIKKLLKMYDLTNFKCKSSELTRFFKGFENANK